eukprot:595383-Lingulodinium_polyedra.AAC.1
MKSAFSAFSSPNRVIVSAPPQGWAHSHHQLALIPQGRAPSQTDVNTHFVLQSNYDGTANLMLILNE